MPITMTNCPFGNAGSSYSNPSNDYNTFERAFFGGSTAPYAQEYDPEEEVEEIDPGIDIASLNRHPLEHDPIWGGEWSSSVSERRGRGDPIGKVYEHDPNQEMEPAGWTSEWGRHALDEHHNLPPAEAPPFWQAMRRQQSGGSVGDVMVDLSEAEPPGMAPPPVQRVSSAQAAYGRPAHPAGPPHVSRGASSGNRPGGGGTRMIGSQMIMMDGGSSIARPVEPPPPPPPQQPTQVDEVCMSLHSSAPSRPQQQQRNFPPQQPPQQPQQRRMMRGGPPPEAWGPPPQEAMMMEDDGSMMELEPEPQPRSNKWDRKTVLEKQRQQRRDDEMSSRPRPMAHGSQAALKARRRAERHPGYQPPPTPASYQPQQQYIERSPPSPLGNSPPQNPEGSQAALKARRKAARHPGPPKVPAGWRQPPSEQQTEAQQPPPAQHQYVEMARQPYPSDRALVGPPMLHPAAGDMSALHYGSQEALKARRAAARGF